MTIILGPAEKASNYEMVVAALKAAGDNIENFDFISATVDYLEKEPSYPGDKMPPTDRDEKGNLCYREWDNKKPVPTMEELLQCYLDIIQSGTLAEFPQIDVDDLAIAIAGRLKQYLPKKTSHNVNLSEISTILDELKAEFTSMSAKLVQIIEGQDILAELAIKADDTFDIEAVMSQLQATSGLAFNLSEDVAKLKEISTQVSDFEGFIGQIKKAIETANQKTSLTGEETKAEYKIKEIKVELTSTSSEFISTKENYAFATKNAGYSQGAFNAVSGISKPGEYVRFRSSNSVFAGLTSRPLQLDHWSDFNAAFYGYSTKQFWFSLGSDYGKNKPNRQVKNQNTELRLLIGDRKEIIFQQLQGDEWVTQYSSVVAAFSSLFFGAVFNAEESEVSGITLGKIVQVNQE